MSKENLAFFIVEKCGCCGCPHGLDRACVQLHIGYTHTGIALNDTVLPYIFFMRNFNSELKLLKKCSSMFVLFNRKIGHLKFWTGT